MIKKLRVTGAVMAAAAGVTLPAAPAQADGWSDNWSGNVYSTQSGNSLGDIAAFNEGAGNATNVNNINGIATTASNGGTTVTYIFY
ncbi:hypothetical protein [Nonomuraea guangzhouensis]|uniref:Uncharacterized protein n=1 Tax=Nonomuraea guangzhouensis TaxID=1291555 RepID=A0ABW4GWL3_9ACTN|nr:hypothetical protein [Nonomuraea guangzhouensis]